MDKELSAGGVISKNEFGEIYILLIKYYNGTYGFPKGHVELGESLEDAVRREIKEEIGLEQIKIIKELGGIDRYSRKKNGELVKKIIKMFLVYPLNFSHNDFAEHEFEWVNLSTAIKSMKYREDGDFLLGIKNFL